MSDQIVTSQEILDRLIKLEGKINELQKSTDIQQSDQNEDRKHFTENDVRMGAIEIRLKELADRFKRLTRDVVDGVQEVIDEAPKEIADQVLDQANSQKGKKLKSSLWARIWGK